jgi:hypothetical protein
MGFMTRLSFLCLTTWRMNIYLSTMVDPGDARDDEDTAMTLTRPMTISETTDGSSQP